MTEIAIIGGSGLDSLPGLEICSTEKLTTPYGDPSGPVSYGKIHGTEVVFLPRHGPDHTIAPHKINYRANIHALKNIGIEQIIAVAAVGGITGEMLPGTIVIPDQIIDYTWSRQHTFFEGSSDQIVHIDFTHPYCEALRQHIIESANRISLPILTQATYAATQGPRLESIAEINRLQRDGCDLVGMTGMPEASLARELDICYASCCVVANRAAGKAAGEITMQQIEAVLEQAMGQVRSLLSAVLQ